MKKYKTIDLFAGMGGIRIGFEKFNFETVYSNDFDQYCKITYDENFISSKLHVEDITKVPLNEIPDFDFMLGGFPCQPFSVAGYRKGFNDEKGRGNVFFHISNILEHKKPLGFMLENVKNLESHDKGNTFKVIRKILVDLGYHVKYKVLNTMEYGNIPQNRERIYIVGFKERKITDAFKFPKPIKLNKKISELLEINVDKKYYYNGKSLFDRIKDHVLKEDTAYQWRRKYVRENKKGVCPTLTANMGMGGHNVPIIRQGDVIRKLTPRECARFQGYPDEYLLPKTISDARLYKQIGNSVSIPVIERIAKEIDIALKSAFL